MCEERKGAGVVRWGLEGAVRLVKLFVYSPTGYGINNETFSYSPVIVRVSHRGGVHFLEWSKL